jgi:hypothetical protein
MVGEILVGIGKHSVKLPHPTPIWFESNRLQMKFRDCDAKIGRCHESDTITERLPKYSLKQDELSILRDELTLNLSHAFTIDHSDGHPQIQIRLVS